MKWAQVSITTSEEASDAVANHLFELDAIGIELKDESASTVKLISYFPMDDRVGERVGKVRQFLNQLLQWGINPYPAEVSLKSVSQADWAEQWRSAFPPQRIGKRFVIAPTWHQVTPQTSEILIRLDPGMAFGTGQHPTTQLSLELLEDVVTGGEVIVDLGTGSGILTIAAAKLGAKQIDAVDADETTIPIARENFRLNGVESNVRLYSGDGLKTLEGIYHLIVANMLTKVILPMIPHFPRFLKRGGEVILSGIMVSEAEQVEEGLTAHGFRLIETRRREDWVGIWAELN
jgi:ribosomal protein L11 methyltransferase